MKSKLASLLCCLIVLINLSGCTKVTQLVKDSQPTKAELLDEINTEHQRWEAAPAADLPVTSTFRTSYRLRANGTNESSAFPRSTVPVRMPFSPSSSKPRPSGQPE